MTLYPSVLVPSANSSSSIPTALLRSTNSRTEAAAVQQVGHAHAAGTANVAIVPISASERQRRCPTALIQDLSSSAFKPLHLGHLEILTRWPTWMSPISIAPSFQTVRCNTSNGRNMRSSFVPSSSYWPNYRRDRDLNPVEPSADPKWINAKCDVQALWSHIHYRRQVFDASYANFRSPTNSQLDCTQRQPNCVPCDAAALLESSPALTFIFRLLFHFSLQFRNST